MNAPLSVLDYARIAARVYEDAPDWGDPKSSARAKRYGNAVAFPGTNNVACWLADLNIDVVPVDGMGQVHEGFWDAVKVLQGPLMGQQNVDATVGHSEGAALALLYGALLCLAGRPPRAVYAFEAPMISIDGTIADIFKRCGVPLLITRCGEDIVPEVPRVTHAWQHPGPLWQFGKSRGFPLPEIMDHMIDWVQTQLAASLASLPAPFAVNA